MIHYTPGKWAIAFAFSLKGSVFPMAFAWAFPCSLLSMGLHSWFRHRPDLQYLGAGDVATGLLSGFTFVLGFLVVFRSQQAYARWWEGGTLLQQLRGEWFNAYSNLMAFCNSAAEKEQDVLEFQHRLVRLTSLLYCTAIQSVSSMKNQDFELIDIKDFDHDSLQFLMKAHDPCEVCLQWIQRLIGEANDTQVLKVAPPILSRVYNQLGNGIVQLNNARKITDFPIPFPLAQMITFMLLVHWAITAFVCAVSVEATHWAGVLSFIVVFSYWSINYIAVELEQPFGDDANDLPLHDMQQDLNTSLCQLLQKEAQHAPTFHFKQEHHQLCTSKQGVEEIMKEKETIIISQVSTTTVPPTDSSEEIDEQYNAMPPVLYVKSAVDLNSSSSFISSDWSHTVQSKSSCNGMNQGSGSGKPGQQPIPPKMESSSSSSQNAEYGGSCTCKSGYCANKGPPSLGTVRRPGCCSSHIGKHANAVTSASTSTTESRSPRLVAVHDRSHVDLITCAV